jgi:hypothetical protein
MAIPFRWHTSRKGIVSNFAMNRSYQKIIIIKRERLWISAKRKTG